MTERNFTEVVPGFYRTRGGDLAEILQVDNPRLKSSYPVRGLIGCYSVTWTIAGFASNTGPESQEDLIEFLGTEKPKEKKTVKKTVTRWVNIDADGYTRTFDIREIADIEQNGDRIACVEMTGEYEVEVYE